MRVSTKSPLSWRECRSPKIFKNFRTALYSRQYHPRALENRIVCGFRLQGVFLPHMSAEKQKAACRRKLL